MFEKPTDQLAKLKVEMMDKTAYCNQRRIILLDDTAKRLKDGKSDPKFLPFHFPTSTMFVMPVVGTCSSTC